MHALNLVFYVKFPYDKSSEALLHFSVVSFYLISALPQVSQLSSYQEFLLLPPQLMNKCSQISYFFFPEQENIIPNTLLLFFRQIQTFEERHHLHLHELLHLLKGRIILQNIPTFFLREKNSYLLTEGKHTSPHFLITLFDMSTLPHLAMHTPLSQSLSSTEVANLSTGF